MLGFGYVVCAVVKAGYGDCIARNLDIAGEVFPVAKCLAIAVIVCGVDFNVCDICRSNEVRRDIIRQDSGAAKINAGLTGALDEKTGRQVLDYICKLHTEYGFTIVMVTHNANIAEMANTVIRMNSGEIAEIYVNTVQKSAYEIGW